MLSSESRPISWARATRYSAAFAALLVAALVFSTVGSAAPTGSTDLKITKTANATSVKVGSPLTYTIVVENLGPDAATGVSISDPLPNRVKYVSASTTLGSCALQGQKLICPIGTLETGATAKVSTATVTLGVMPQKAGALSNTATVTGDQADPVTSNNQATVTTKVLAPTPTPTPPPGGATCRGIAATIIGTAGADNLLGTGGRDVIVGLGGNDTIAALAGRDLVCAGGGDDYVGAGSAADRIFGGGGKDRLVGRGGADGLKGNAGNDVLNGNRGSDRLRGGRGFDVCSGGPGLDSVRGCER
jgi:uncharacterized repeat protein (TIGR01451 family)